MVGRPALSAKMFSILTDRLPDRTMVDGEMCFFKTDFKRWIIFETLMTDGNLSDSEKTAVILPLCLKKLPSTIEIGIKACVKFYRGNDAEGTEKCAASKPIYSFLYDADLIFSAFMSQYGIDLSDEQMHWYKFKALFKGLESSARFSEVMQIRSINLSDIKNDEVKDSYRRLKKIWQLPDMRSKDEKDSEFVGAVGQFF